MESDTKSIDLLEKTSNGESETTETLHPLHALQLEIANMPDVDPEKVKQAINKILNGTLDILGTESEQLASAERIAAQIIAEAKDK